MAVFSGGRHCGPVAFTVEGAIDKLFERDCSICSKQGEKRR